MSNKVPQLRFKGFTDPWVQRKLGEITDSLDSQRVPIESGNREIGQYPYYGATGVVDYVDGYIFDGEYVLLAEDGANITMRTNPIAYKTSGKFWLNNHAHIMKAHGDAEFLKQSLERISYLKYNSGTAQPKLNAKAVQGIELEVPGIEEQSKIGGLFESVDKLIDANQRKLAKLKELKQGYLQRMFPKNGSKFPQLRFSGFADAWEQRKVSELADRYDNHRVPITASERVAGGTPYYGANGIQDHVEGFTHDGEFILVAEDGANDLQNYPVQYVDGKVWVNNHAHVLQAKEETADNKFLMNALKHTNIEPYLVGGGRAKLNADVMMKIDFKVPTLPEQIQIGKFFDNLDHLITLHQRKSDLLKELKKGFLQKMFV